MGKLADGHAHARRERRLAGGANPADFSEALARGLSVLRAFDADHQQWTQAGLARTLGLSRATVRRAVLTLEHLGYLRAAGHTYTLTPQVLKLAESFVTSDVVSTVVQPVCEEISVELNASCSVAVLDGEDVVMVARAMPQRGFAGGSGVGFRIPAHRSALGRVLLAHLDAPDLIGAGVTGEAQTLEQIRNDGYCYIAHDVELGFHSIAVPLARRDGLTVAAMNVGTTVDHLEPEAMHGRVLTTLQQRSAELRSLLIS